LFAMPKR